MVSQANRARMSSASRPVPKALPSRTLENSLALQAEQGVDLRRGEVGVGRAS